MSPDANGQFKGISVPELPWQAKQPEQPDAPEPKPLVLHLTKAQYRRWKIRRIRGYWRRRALRKRYGFPFL